jgi:hypothetical protein
MRKIGYVRRVGSVTVSEVCSGLSIELCSSTSGMGGSCRLSSAAGGARFIACSEFNGRPMAAGTSRGHPPKVPNVQHFSDLDEGRPHQMRSLRTHLGCVGCVNLIWGHEMQLLTWYM